jgi:hypothetical protein
LRNSLREKKRLFAATKSYASGNARYALKVVMCREKLVSERRKVFGSPPHLVQDELVRVPFQGFANGLLDEWIWDEFCFR